LTRNPGKTLGAAWHSAWNSTALTPNSRQNIRRRLAFRLMFYQNSIIPAVYQAIAGLLACNMAQNIDVCGCLSGYSRTFSLHFVLNVIFCCGLKI
jgi:hypothetical protein